VDDLAPAIVAVILILTTGGVAILRPIAKRAGDLFEAMAREKREPKRAVPPEDAQRMVELMESLHARLDRLEERQDFTDSLLSAGREGKSLPRGRPEPRSPDASV
jgi:tetrahydromethanopterin S-methyltransferase subunit G